MLEYSPLSLVNELISEALENFGFLVNESSVL